jgi:hypothetical protein
MPFPQELAVRDVQYYVLDRLPKVNVLPHLMNTDGAMDISGPVVGIKAFSYRTNIVSPFRDASIQL